MFEKVTLKYDGKEYIVKPENVLMLIAKVESVISLQDLANENPSMAKISMGYACALNYAGANVSADEIYGKLFEDGNAELASSAVTGLLTLMLPPSHLNKFQPKKKTSVKSKPKQKKA